MAQCVSNRCKNLLKEKKYLGVRCTLRMNKINMDTNAKLKNLGCSNS